MKNLLLDEANNLYRCAKHCIIQKHTVENSEFRAFCTDFRDLERDLGEQAQNDYWIEILREIKRFRFTLYATPLPMNIQAKQIVSLLQKQRQQCQYFFPSFVPRLQTILDQARILVELHENPLLDKILELAQQGKGLRIALLIKEIYLFPLVADILARHPAFQRIELVNTYQLRGAQWYHKLLVIGPRYWYPNYIFRAPRAEEVHFLLYSWINDPWINQPIFQSTTTTEISYGNILSGGTIQESLKKSGESSKIQEYEFTPDMNWHALSTNILKQTLDDHIQDTVSAKLYLLGNNHAVFLENNDHVKVLVLDFEIEEEDKENTQHLRRIPLSQLHPGMFLLLRTEGGGDYIVPIADKILGNKASHLRELQAQWKTPLRNFVDAKGLFEVCIELLDHGGSKHVNEINLRYWISSRSIRPHDDDDFHAILALVDLQEKEDLYRDAANKIETAHRSAGFYIRKLLLQHVANTSIYDIHKQGYMEFELPQSDGGSLTAFRIEHISPEVVMISASRAGHPVQVKDF